MARMLVLMNAGKPDIQSRVVDDGVALKVSLRIDALEGDRAVPEPTELELIERIDRSGEKQMVKLRKRRRFEGCLKEERYFLVIEKPANQFGVSLFRNALENFVIVTVVVVKSHRQTLENRGGQLALFTTPLLFCIAVEERLIQVASQHLESLLLEVGRFADVLVGQRRDEQAGFRRIERLAEKLIDRVEINREGKNAAVDLRLHPVHVRPKSGEAVDVIPDVFAVGIENVRAILMHHDPRGRIAFCMTIAADVIPRFADRNAAVTALGQFSGQDPPANPAPTIT